MLPFTQVDSSLERRFEGTGLGLPLAKLLVEGHGGSLHRTSESGKGTEVAVRMPAVKNYLRTTGLRWRSLNQIGEKRHDLSAK